MTFAESRRYLFTLYASSKRQADHQAGRFGVGFWSIMRFQPSRIIIRSCTADDSGWEVQLDGELEQVSHRQVELPPGTEIVLERPIRTKTVEKLSEQVLTAARSDGRFLTCRDDPARQLKIIVNGKRADSPFSLAAPSVSFRHRGLRGVVGLGRQQQVELFVHGLRVRTAASLDDLLSEEPASQRRKTTLPELPQGLVPQVLLDSDQLEVLLARSDAREDRRLRRYVAIARNELARLVRRQLDRSAPVSLPRRLMESMQRLWYQRWVRVTSGITAALLLLFCLVLSVVRLLPQHFPDLPGVRESAARDSTVPAEPPETRPYRDPAISYHGPAVDAISATSRMIDLRYQPVDRELLLAGIIVDRMAENGLPLSLLDSRDADQLKPYQGAPCERDCIVIDLGAASDAGLLRLPVPSGFAVDPGWVRLSTGGPPPLLATAAGEPVLRFSTRYSGRILYQVGPAGPQQPPSYPAQSWPALPSALALRASELRELPLAERVIAALAIVRSLVVYDRSAAVVRRHRDARLAGDGIIPRTLAIGAGDCDVQNSLLVAVLRRAGVPARLAVGFLGRDGTVAPGQHAWVELLDERGHWRVADASVSPEGGEPVTRPRPLSPPAGTSSDIRHPGPPQRHRWSAAGAAVLWMAAIVALAGAAATARQLRARRTLHLQRRTDMAALLDGALRRPEAYQQVGSLFTRPVVPLLGGRAMSLRQARRRATQGRLLRSHGTSRLARRAAGKGAMIIDTGTREGAVVAELLGAADVDLWDQLLANRRPAPFLGTVNKALRQAGERWQVCVASGALEPLTTIDMPALGRNLRLVVLAAETALCDAAATCFDRHPWQAVLLVLDAAAQHLDLPARQRSRVLAEPAARAVAELAKR